MGGLMKWAIYKRNGVKVAFLVGVFIGNIEYARTIKSRIEKASRDYGLFKTTGNIPRTRKGW